MNVTLVLGAVPDAVARHARELLAGSDRVTHVDGRCGDLVAALMNSRHPVLVDDVPAWVAGLEDRAEERIEEVVLTVRSLPFPVVLISREGDEEHLARVNERLSAIADQVHLVVAGRVLDLSDAPRIRTPRRR